MKKIISVILAVCLLSGCCPLVFAAENAAPEYETALDYVVSSGKTVSSGTKTASDTLLNLKYFLAKIVNAVSNLVINDVTARTLATVLPSAATVKDYKSFDLDSYEGFYAGQETFLDEPARDAVWSLGYGSASVLPPDLADKAYAKGAYLPLITGSEMYKDDDGEYEDLRVRVIILDDNSGRGAALFAVVDCMGISNDNVRLIRNAIKDIAEENNIVSVNISATHIHTGIDTQGIWTNTFSNLLTNSVSRITGNVSPSVDRTFLESIISGTRQATEQAVADLQPGKLMYTKIDMSNYLFDRTAPIVIDPYLYKLEFFPNKKSAKSTVIASLGCHPESASYDWDCYVDENGKKGFDRRFSADFVYYMDKLASLAGFNFIFIQGEVCTASSKRALSNDGVDTNAHSTAVRLGYELGYITFTSGMTEDERIAFNKKTGDRLGIAEYGSNPDYTVWYEDLPTLEAEEVKPLLNIANRQFFCKVSNFLVAAFAKAGIVDVNFLRDGLFNYYTVTEVGYMELGDTLNVYISPGETFGELLMGGSSLDGFPCECIRDRLGENTIIFDLVNDAAGYVEPDNYFVMVGMQYNEDSGSYDGDTWCIFSYGKHTASTFLTQLYSLAESRNR